MKIDKFSKIMLFFIAFFLGIIAVRPLLEPKVVQASNETIFETLLFAYAIDVDGDNHFAFFDTESGEILTLANHSMLYPDIKHYPEYIGQFITDNDSTVYLDKYEGLTNKEMQEIIQESFDEILKQYK